MALFAVIDNTIATRIVRVELDATASTSVTAIHQNIVSVLKYKTLLILHA